jgi:hypothetical protein
VPDLKNMVCAKSVINPIREISDANLVMLPVYKMILITELVASKK